MSDPTPDPANQPAPKPAAPAEPEHFSRDYVRELREESKTWRQKAQGHETDARTAREAAVKAATEAAAKIAEAAAAAEARVIRAEMKALASRAGMVDLDGLKLLDLSAVKLTEAGEVEGADALIEAAKKAKPWLFGAASTSSTTPAPKPGEPKAKLAKDMTPEEFRAAKIALGIRT